MDLGPIIPVLNLGCWFNETTCYRFKIFESERCPHFSGVADGIQQLKRLQGANEMAAGADMALPY